MNKIEIHDLQELISQHYPLEVIKGLIDQVLEVSMLVKTDYPDYKNWFLETQVPGIYEHTRNIIVAHIGKRIVGFVSLKRTSEEKKICTFYIEKNFRKNKIGSILVERAIEYLETDKPLITIPLNKLNEFTRIGERYEWQITDMQENLYRVGTTEVIVNGFEREKTGLLVPSKSLKKTWNIYKIERIKQIKNTFIANLLGIKKHIIEE